MCRKIVYTRLIVTWILLLGFASTLFAQVDDRQLSVGINYAVHGSGDMGGMMLQFDYRRFYRKRLSVVYNLGMSLHGSKAIPYRPIDDPAIPTDLRTETPRWVTAGIQVASLLQYHLSKHPTAGLRLAAGPILRYQLNSYPLSYTYYGPSNPWFPQPFYVFQAIDDKRINLGYQIRLGYDFQLPKNKQLGINSFFQNDSNGDTLVGLGLSFGINVK